MRLFVAVWPPAEVARDLSAAVAALAGEEEQARAVRQVVASQVHVTLAFLGEVPDRRRADLERRLERVASRYPPLRLRLAGAGRFGDRVLFVKLDGDRDRLSRLASSVTASARRAALAVEERPFRAHVTVARARPGTDLRPSVAALDAYRSAAWTTTEIHLVHSRLGGGPGGRAVYDTVVSWPLTGSRR